MLIFFWETTSGFISVFSASWFDSGYMFLPVYGGFCTRILRSILVLLSLLPFTAHCLVLTGTCCAAVYGVVEFHVFLREKVDSGS